MCSIQEAWGDFDAQQHNQVPNPSPNTHHDKLKFVKQNFQDLDSQRQVLDCQRQQIDTDILNSKYIPADRVGEPVTQTDNRRQYAQTSEDIFNRDFDRKLMSKPLPDRNSFTRGVHSKYSREKRIDNRIQPNSNIMTNVSTDSDPQYFSKVKDNRPDYLDLYDKSYNVTPNVGPLGRGDNAGMPLAANDDDDTDTFQDVSQNYFVDVSKPQDNFGNHNHNDFTPEKITQKDLLRNAQNNSVVNNSNNSKQPVITTHIEPKKMELHLNDKQKIQELQKQIAFLMDKMQNLEHKMKNVENNKCHDIILIIVIAIFVLFIIDNLFKLGKFS